MLFRSRFHTQLARGALSTRSERYVEPTRSRRRGCSGGKVSRFASGRRRKKHVSVGWIQQGARDLLPRLTTRGGSRDRVAGDCGLCVPRHTHTHPTHVSLQDLVSLVGVVQHVDGEVGDGDGGRGGEGDEQHQDALALLQGQVQLVCLLLAQAGQVDRTPGGGHTHTVETSIRPRSQTR